MRGRLIKRWKSSWTIVISLPRDPVTGKRKQKWVSVKGARKMAERKLTQLLYQLDGGVNLDPARLSFGDYLSAWIERIKPSVSAVTWQRYAGIVRQHVIPDLGHVPLNALKKAHLEGHYARMLAKGLSPSTAHYHHVLIFHALRDAVTGELLTRNVAEAVPAPKFETPEMKAWDIEEMQQFLRANEQNPLYPLFCLALYSGMRRSELLGLQWDDIDFTVYQLSVRRAYHRVNGIDSFTRPKSKKSIRAITLSPSVVDVLRKHYEAQGNLDSSHLVFSRGDRPLNPNTVTWAWKKACWVAGVRSIRLHDARHTHATLLLLRQRVPLKLVQERLGHSSIQITSDTYGHVLAGLQADVAEGFDIMVSKDL